jgi:hypothetical protein
MQEVFEDGPKRDRRLWLGDLRLQVAFSSESAMTAGCGLPAEVTVSRAISSNCRRNLREDLWLDVLPARVDLPRRYCLRYLKVEIKALSRKFRLNGSQTSLSVSPKVKCRWAGASGGLPTLRQLNCRSSSWLQQQDLWLDVLPARVDLPRRYCLRYLKVENRRLRAAG